jgi:hypothetical protein
MRIATITKKLDAALVMNQDLIKKAYEQEYEALAERIAIAFQNEYWDTETLNYPGGTQTANLLPLAFGLTPEGMNPRNHFALGCAGEWIWNILAGINISDEQPGFKRAIIRPQPAGDLNWAKAGYETNYGLLSVDWKLENGKFILNLTVPPNTTAEVELPGVEAGSVVKEGGVEVGSAPINGLSEIENGHILAAAGSYVFTVE